MYIQCSFPPPIHGNGVYILYDENLGTDLRNIGRNHGSIKLLWVTFQIVKSLKYSMHNN